MTEEVWKATQYDNYEVSSLGRVRTTTRGIFGHVLKEPKIHGLLVTPKGYTRVMLCINGKQKNVSLAQLVAQAFIGERPERAMASYKNGNKADCTADNLFYGTPAEIGAHNQVLNYAKYGDKSTIGRRKKSAAEMEMRYQRALDAHRLHTVEGKSLKETGEILSITESGVSRLINGSNNTVLQKAMAWAAESAREPHS